MYMEEKEILSTFDSFKNLKVLIVGDVMIDSYIYGNVERISPEAPVPVVTVENKEYRLGGASNVALNIQALGATPILCSIIGDDSNGKQFKSLLRDNNISSDFIIVSDQRKTTIKNRIISGSQQMIRFDEESNDFLNENEEDLLIKLVKEQKDIDVIIFQDYDKGCLTYSVISEIIGYANSKGIPTAVDPKKRNFLNYNNCTLFKPNLKELVNGLNIDYEIDDEVGLVGIAMELNINLVYDILLLTLSEKGLFIIDDDNYSIIPAQYRNVSDVSGAGDTVISIASLCLALNMETELIGILSNLGGGIVCEQLGVVPIDKDKLIVEIVNYFK